MQTFSVCDTASVAFLAGKLYVSLAFLLATWGCVHHCGQLHGQARGSGQVRKRSQRAGQDTTQEGSTSMTAAAVAMPFCRQRAGPWPAAGATYQQ
jgi:hypothetical protein